MSTTDFSSAFAGLDQLFERVKEGATRGLALGAQALEADAKATTTYGDSTGATRASTVAYVGSDEEDGDQATTEARDAGEAKNPGQGVVDSADDPGEDVIVVVLTAMMAYDGDLETRSAGAQAFLGPAMDRHASGLLAAAGQGIAQELS